MERRHQVFVSSTYADLIDERSEITKALLELDCFPAGMEMFPATSGSAWDLIKGVIDDSDYYCLVIAGRYGSTDEEGLGYTEKEYRYALEAKKPIMVFLHKSPGSIPADFHEKSEAGREKLESFKEKVKNAHHCKFWTSAEELGGQVSRSLIQMKKTFPSDGWIPGRFAADSAGVIENATLKAKVAQLEAELLLLSTTAKSMAVENIAGSSDVYSVMTSFIADGAKDWIEGHFEVSWDDLLRYVGPSLLGECSDEEFVQKIHLCMRHRILNEPKYSKLVLSKVIVPYVILDTIKVQLRALRYMAPGVKRRAVSDSRVYWRITEEGEARLIQIRAIKKTPPASPVGALSQADFSEIAKE